MIEGVGRVAVLGTGTIGAVSTSFHASPMSRSRIRGSFCRQLSSSGRRLAGTLSQRGSD